METNLEIERLQADVKRLSDELSVASMALAAAKNAAAGIAEGDVVVRRDGSVWKVTIIKNGESLHGVKRLKDGKWGEVRHYIGILDYNVTKQAVTT